MKGNKIKEITEPEHNTDADSVKQPGIVIRFLRKILGGSVFESEQSFKTLPFLLYVALLALLFITNNYMIEYKTRKINKLQKEVKELKYETITLKSKLLTISRQSKLSEKLSKMGIKENTEPVKTIIIDNQK